MRLLSLVAHGFRNLDHVDVQAHERLNVFVGENGVGKTNLLEAVHLAAALRPLRPVERAKDLVRFDLEQGVVKGTFDLDGPLPVEVLLEARGRKATLAGKQVKDIGQVAARVGVVSFTPEDLSIVRGAPERRRRALDRYAYGLSSSFAQIARRYEAALSQRNRLLKEWPVDPALLDAYTEPLIEAGVELLVQRREAAGRWAPAFMAAVEQITAGRVEPALRYRSSLLDEEEERSGIELAADELAARFRARLRDQKESEQSRRTTLSGPHLDDLVVSMNDRKARHLASQGEARALVLALKIAEVRTAAEARQAAPLLLLDDVAGELDPSRARHLFEVVDEVGAQTFVTCTHLDVLPPCAPARVFHVEQGKLVGTEELEA